MSHPNQNIDPRYAYPPQGAYPSNQYGHHHPGQYYGAAPGYPPAQMGYPQHPAHAYPPNAYPQHGYPPQGHLVPPNNYQQPSHAVHHVHPAHAAPAPIHQQPVATPAYVEQWCPSHADNNQIDIWFKGLDKDSCSIIPGIEIAKFLQHSNLPRESLRTIWALVDSESKGYVNRVQFNTIIRLVSISCSPIYAGASPTMERYYATMRQNIPLPGALLAVVLPPPVIVTTPVTVPVPTEPPHAHNTIPTPVHTPSTIPIQIPQATTPTTQVTPTQSVHPTTNRFIPPAIPETAEDEDDMEFSDFTTAAVVAPAAPAALLPIALPSPQITPTASSLLGSRSLSNNNISITPAVNVPIASTNAFSFDDADDDFGPMSGYDQAPTLSVLPTQQQPLTVAVPNVDNSGYGDAYGYGYGSEDVHAHDNDDVDISDLLGPPVVVPTGVPVSTVVEPPKKKFDIDSVFESFSMDLKDSLTPSNAVAVSEPVPAIASVAPISAEPIAPVVIAPQAMSKITPMERNPSMNVASISVAQSAAKIQSAFDDLVESDLQAAAFDDEAFDDFAEAPVVNTVQPSMNVNNNNHVETAVSTPALLQRDSSVEDRVSAVMETIYNNDIAMLGGSNSVQKQSSNADFTFDEEDDFGDFGGFESADTADTTPNVSNSIPVETTTIPAATLSAVLHVASPHVEPQISFQDDDDFGDFGDFEGHSDKEQQQSAIVVPEVGSKDAFVFDDNAVSAGVNVTSHVPAPLVSAPSHSNYMEADLLDFLSEPVSTTVPVSAFHTQNSSTNDFLFMSSTHGTTVSDDLDLFNAAPQSVAPKPTTVGVAFDPFGSSHDSSADFDADFGDSDAFDPFTSAAPVNNADSKKDKLFPKPPVSSASVGNKVLPPSVSMPSATKNVTNNKQQDASPGARKPLSLSELELLSLTLAEKHLYEEAYSCVLQTVQLHRLEELLEQKRIAMENDELELAVQLKKDISAIGKQVEGSDEESKWVKAAQSSRVGDTIHETYDLVNSINQAQGAKFKAKFLMKLPPANSPIEGRMKYFITARRYARVIIAINSTHTTYPSQWLKILTCVNAKIQQGRDFMTKFKNMKSVDQQYVQSHAKMVDFIQSSVYIAELGLWVAVSCDECFQHENESKATFTACSEYLVSAQQLWGYKSEFANQSSADITLMAAKLAECSNVNYCNITLRPLSVGSKDGTAANSGTQLCGQRVEEKGVHYMKAALNLWRTDISTTLPVSECNFA